MMTRRVSLVVPLLLLTPGLPAAARADRPITVAGVPVPASDAANVRARLAKALSTKLDAPITLTDGARTVTRPRRALGVRLDLDAMTAGVAAGQAFVPLRLTVNDAILMDALERAGPAFEVPAVGARPYVHAGRLYIAPGAHARHLDVLPTAERFIAALKRDPALNRFSVSLAKEPPAITPATLQGITGVLAAFSTVATPTLERNKNIRVAVESVNGTLLLPGQTFSLNDTVGPRTEERGFGVATVFVNAQPVDGVGGGICQVSSTLFNAVALAGLAIREVHAHSRPVKYLPPGRDATVSWGEKDLRFTNNTGAPVYIDYRFRDRRLHATVYGRKNGHRFTLLPRVRERRPGHVTAQLYRLTWDSGRVARKEQLYDHDYLWEP